jgi:hypothetical protein
VGRLKVKWAGKAAAVCGVIALSWAPTGSTVVQSQQDAGSRDSSHENVTQQWVDHWGDKIEERLHPDIQGAFPGGRSDRYQNAYIARVLPELGLPTNFNWREINKHYAFDGDWFIVEYLFQAEDKKTGRLQREGTLAFGRVKDDRLIVSIEYFDRFVKGLEHVEALPPFRADEMPFPWPDYDGLTRKYRP